MVLHQLLLGSSLILISRWRSRDTQHRSRVCLQRRYRLQQYSELYDGSCLGWFLYRLIPQVLVWIAYTDDWQLHCDDNRHCTWQNEILSQSRSRSNKSACALLERWFISSKSEWCCCTVHTLERDRRPIIRAYRKKRLRREQICRCKELP